MCGLSVAGRIFLVALVGQGAVAEVVDAATSATPKRRKSRLRRWLRCGGGGEMNELAAVSSEMKWQVPKDRPSERCLSYCCPKAAAGSSDLSDEMKRRASRNGEQK